MSHKFLSVAANNSFFYFQIRIKSLELSQKFLGYEKEMTLMEADGALVGIHRPHTDVNQD